MTNKEKIIELKKEPPSLRLPTRRPLAGEPRRGQVGEDQRDSIRALQPEGGMP